MFPFGRFPAIITNSWDDSNNVVVAQCDSQRMHTTDADLAFQYQKNVYANLGSVAFATSGTTDLIRFSGASNIYYPTLKNTSGLADRTFSTGQTLSVSAGGTGTIQFKLDDYEIGGETYEGEYNISEFNWKYNKYIPARTTCSFRLHE